MGLKRDSNGQVLEQDADIKQTPAHAEGDSKTKPERRFCCTFEGCGKSYTRAEHLSRHQLNHNPKDIYSCDFPGCTRSFVRQDLCVRHRERHDAPQRRASDLNSQSSDDEKREGTRRVGRPRLSSLQQPDAEATTPSLARNATSPAVLEAQMVPPGNALDQLLQLGTSNPTPRHFSAPQNVTSESANSPTQMQHLSTNSLSMGSIPLQPQAPFGASNSYPLGAFSDGFNESPASVRDDFTSWLFDEQFQMQNGFLPSSMQNAFGLIEDPLTFTTNPFLATDMLPVLDSNSTINDMNIVDDNTLDVSMSDHNSWISPAKRLVLLGLIDGRFRESENVDDKVLREQVLTGNRDLDDHVLSLKSMQQYLSSYWQHFHAQMPILHVPTFSTESAPDLLILAVLIVGAANLGPHHGKLKTDAASKFATFVAWHLRWQVFMHADFRPPAKLWVFQTLLLLEVYEKMYSTRAMHERAHIHSATMINLMRRGTTLIGDGFESKRPPGHSSPEDAWHRWIEAEATRRTAFAAFIVDATHSVMFGHAAIMVVHELRLPLPCDDALWSATSAAEVGRVHSSLHTHGIRPAAFLDGLKRILTGRKVKTNAFGRMILMAGLLSITWHLHQRDLQISSLGASQALGMPGTWREALTKSFDFWKRDFDESRQHMRNASLAWQQTATIEDRDVCANAMVLHHMSHVALNVEILDCQIYAGAVKLFGRIISRTDYERTKGKVAEWMHTSAARRAVYHAIQLVKPVVTDMSLSQHRQIYVARDDHLLNRAWAMYYASLVLWTYGFAHEGVLKPFPHHLLDSTDARTTTSPILWSPARSTPLWTHDSYMQLCLDDARAFIATVGVVKTPEELKSINSGRNRLVGLIGLLTPTFAESRWQLLREGGGRLEKAIRILRDGELS